MKFLRFALFNWFARTIIKFDFGGKENKTPDRIKAFGVELLYSFVVFFPFLALGLILSKEIQKITSSEIGFKALELIRLFPLFGLCLFVLNKDFFNGQGIVNRFYGFQVVNCRTGLPADPLKCMVRNLTVPFLVFELPFTYINHERRIGDFLAGTKLVQVERKDPQLIFQEMAATNFNWKAKFALIIPTILFTIWSTWSLTSL